MTPDHAADAAASLRHDLLDAQRALADFLADAPLVSAVAAACDAMAHTLRRGGKILACGNGGSLADAAHFCEELTGRFRADRPPLAALACADPGHITCTANDYGYDAVFARWVTALARPGDAVLLLSTSGNSPNLLRAADAARDLGVTTIAFLGRGGGALRGRCTHEAVFPGRTADRVQELHMLALHAAVAHIERSLGHA